MGGGECGRTEHMRNSGRGELITMGTQYWMGMRHLADGNETLTTLTCPTEYNSTMVNTIIAKRNVKLCDKSQKIHFKRAANINISIAAIHTKAVKNSSNKMNVRGNMET